ncbi:hypothetical protein [Roseobacter sp. HKCCD7870]|uniref:hypothetical protein n=1 Tax=Roseobacter sp. HKCCD7870 TaxID=3120343 RepID=UPI0030EC5444
MAHANNLGLRAATLGLNSTGADQNGAHLNLHYAITAHHGLEVNFDLADTEISTIGAVRAGLHLSPASDRRYSLFAYLADFNNESSRLGGLGIQGRREIAGLTLGAYGGFDLRDSAMATRPLGDSDVLFAGGEIRFDLGPSWQGFAQIGLAEFDELRLSTTQVTGEIGVQWLDHSGAVAVTASYGFEEFSNPALRDRGQFRLGVEITLGKRPVYTPLPFADPFLPVVACGL